ncbi:protein couch potato isoform X2 [Dioscorea cayenensis subsp. rotundata]|uniref:Protein couch potato isoform X2 n=1 Tax=Dioscorea cayennensis subsp. rotundata TaxID=55577 RepID=A0AB40AYT8_DIOCR|nr:protein couch potato isoform X2 [Dioscorea cayenensis subsp. rotundata]
MAASYYHIPPPSHYAYSQAPPPVTPQHPPPSLPPPHALPPFDQSQPHIHHQQPSFAPHYSLPPPPYSSRDDEVRTLFIAGLPDDTKTREIYNLFREFPGFQNCQLKSSGPSSQAYGFVVFTDQQSAVAAMHTLNGMVFDLEKESTLFIELAKSNSRPKRSRADDGVSFSSDKRVRGSTAYSSGFPDSGVRSNTHMTGIANSAYNMNGYPSTQSHTSSGHDSAYYKDPSKLLSNSSTFAPQSNDPCPTLFVANLSPTCTEKELSQVFSRCPGFLKLKMQNKNGVPVAFVDFQDVECSTGALNYLQGTHFYSSVGDGMRLEYARSRMGLRKRERKA